MSSFIAVALLLLSQPMNFSAHPSIFQTVFFSPLLEYLCLYFYFSSAYQGMEVHRLYTKENKVYFSREMCTLKFKLYFSREMCTLKFKL